MKRFFITITLNQIRLFPFDKLNSVPDVNKIFQKRIAELDPVPRQCTPPPLQYIAWVFSFVKTSELTTNATGSEGLF